MMMKVTLLVFSLSVIQPIAADEALDRSELLADFAGSTLKHVGAFLEGKKKVGDLASEVAAGMKVQYAKAPETPATAEKYLPGRFQLTARTEVHAHEKGSLTEWADSYAGQVIRTKFKVVRVEPDPENKDLFKTEQLFEALIHGSDGQREMHQYWLASWRLEEGQAVLQDLRETRRELSGLNSKTTAFVDHTARVLKLDRQDLARTLTHGANYWMRRLENAINPDFFSESGVTVVDANGDGRDDVYIPQLAGIPNQLFLAQADGTFIESAAEHGLAILENTSSAIFVDLDNDGDQDAALGTATGLAIFRNTGEGHYELVNLIDDVTFVFGITAADYDGDGLLDLYACQYFGSRADDARDGLARGNFPVPYPIYDANNGGRNLLLRNHGELKFEDVTKAVGLDDQNSRYSFAAMWEDWDNDGDPDLYVVNDFGRNNYYQNNQGVFQDATAAVGLTSMAFGMGVTSGDYNGDGWLDIHVSNMFSSAGNRVTTQDAFKPGAGKEVKSIFLDLARGNALMMNQRGQFSDRSVEAGITVGRWSWASLSPDLNNDGYEDLLVANGFVTGVELDDL